MQHNYDNMRHINVDMLLIFVNIQVSYVNMQDIYVTIRGYYLSMQEFISTCEIIIRDDFNCSIVNFPYLCSNIPLSPVYGVFVSQLIR